MKALYCQYCGNLLNERCNCEKEISEYEENMVDELENRADTHMCVSSVMSKVEDYLSLRKVLTSDGIFLFSTGHYMRIR